MVLLWAFALSSPLALLGVPSVVACCGGCCLGVLRPRVSALVFLWSCSLWLLGSSVFWPGFWGLSFALQLAGFVYLGCGPADLFWCWVVHVSVMCCKSFRLGSFNFDFL